jgi:hypothetical protein
VVCGRKLRHDRHASAAGVDVSAARMPIRCGPLWTPLLIAVGMAPKAAYVDIGATSVRVRMGLGFRAEFPRTSIRSPRRVPDRLSIGVHGWRGGWLVNGARGPLVAFSLDPPARARVYGVPVRLAELALSVDDPDALVAELSSEDGASA